MTKEIIIDAEDGILGRIASFAAKQALQGKTVKVVNCEKVLLTGNRKMILEQYQKAKARGGSAMRGPNFPSSSERIMKRAIRGMLKYKRGRGEDAFDKVRCYNNVPKEFEKAEKIPVQNCNKRKHSRTEMKQRPL